MNLQRREEIRVIAECPNDRHWAQEMRRAVAELLAHIDTLEQTAAERVIRDGSRGPTPDYTGEGSAWVPPVETLAVVVPEPTVRQWIDEVLYVAREDPEPHATMRAATRWFRERARAIPADRLGEGMVAVDSLLYAALIGLEKAVVREWGLCCTGARLWDGQKAIADRRDALRTNQGGANHD